MFGNLSEEGIEHVLQYQVYGRIGCHANDKTYIVPICYAYHENKIYARTFEGLKLKMMRANPQVCFQLENLDSMGKWQSVVCWGEFEELTETIVRNRGIDILQNRITAKINDKNLQVSHEWPFSMNDSNIVEGVIFCIHLHEKTGRFEKT
jgi:uncharacterized protein